MENEEKDEVIVDNVEEPNEEVKEEVVEPKEEPKPEKVKRTPEEELAYLEGRAKRIRKDLGKDVEPKSTQTGELDDTEALILEVKGVVETDEVSLYEKWKKDTGRKPREILNNDIFKKELAELRKERVVKDATPTSTKRSGQQSTDNEDYWFQKYEATGELPKNMPKGMAIRLVNRRSGEYSRTNPYEK